jgi:hypothetical protein
MPNESEVFRIRWGFSGKNPHIKQDVQVVAFSATNNKLKQRTPEASSGRARVTNHQISALI